MSQLQKRKEKYRKSIEPVVKWMVSHQKPDGSFGDVVSMSHYMALPAGLL
jgi:squalene cyclase